MVLAKTFKELEIWKIAIQIAKRTYALTQQLPKEERYGLVVQMRRAAISLSANIAEGFRRQRSKEFQQFLRIALGSAAELESYCELCRELTLVNGNVEQLFSDLERFQRMTNAMRARLKLSRGSS